MSVHVLCCVMLYYKLLCRIMLYCIVLTMSQYIVLCYATHRKSCAWGTSAYPYIPPKTFIFYTAFYYFGVFNLLTGIGDETEVSSACARTRPY